MFRGKFITAMVVAMAAWPAVAHAITDPPSRIVPTAIPKAEAAPPVDLRSPDARDAAGAAAPPVDLRSPDARDAARERASAVVVSSSASPSRSTPSVSDGFAWGDAGIGAAVTLALMGLAGATVLLALRGRRRAPTT